MIGHPRLSVVLPTVDALDTLERSLCSVLDQDVDGLEVLVVTDPHDEETARVLAPYTDQCRTVHTTETGWADAVQIGMAQATAPTVGLLMPSDLFLPGALAAACKHFDQSADHQWLVLDGLHITAEGHRMVSENLQAPQDLQALLMHRSGDLPLSGAFFRTELVREQTPHETALQHAHAYSWACHLMAQGLVPQVLDGKWMARRQKANGPSAQAVIDAGFETINTAHQYADFLPLRQRAAVWASLDERTRIYTLAASEARQSQARGFLWKQLLRHPWWLADEHYRHGLIHGLPQANVPPRLAA